MAAGSSAPSAGHAVVGVKLRLDVADPPQQLVQHRLTVTMVTVLDASHPLCGVAVHLHGAVTMGTKGLGGSEVKQVEDHGVRARSEPDQNRLTAASLVLNSFSRCSRYCSISAWASSLACFRRRFFPAHRTEPSEPESGSEPEPQPSSFQPTNSFIFP